MKTLLVLMAFLASLPCYSQDSIAGISTTEEEYNYATKGYPETIAKGLDIKKGYLVEPLGERVETKYSIFEMKVLIRESKNEVAAIIVTAKNKLWNSNVYHVCVPINNTDLAGRYFSDLNKWDKPMLLDYSQLTSLQMAHLLTGLIELEKNKK